MVNYGTLKKLGLLLMHHLSASSLVRGDGYRYGYGYCSDGRGSDGILEGGGCNENEMNCKGCGGNWYTDDVAHIIDSPSLEDGVNKKGDASSERDEQVSALLPYIEVGDAKDNLHRFHATRNLATCLSAKKVTMYKFCIEGDDDPGPNGEHRLKLDGQWLYNGFRNYREGQCHNLNIGLRTVKGWKSLTVGTEEHDDLSENDSYFATMSSSQWYNPTCETYEIILAKQHSASKRMKVCWNISAQAVARGVTVGAGAESCTEWTQPSESYLWYMKIEPAQYRVIALESMQFPGSYLDAGGDRRVWTAKKDYSYNNYRKWKIIDIYNGMVALESMQFPGSYLDAGGDRRVWTAKKDYSHNNYRKWKIIDIGNGMVALESMQFPGSYLDAGGDRRVWTAKKDYSHNNYRKWKIISI